MRARRGIFCVSAAASAVTLLLAAMPGAAAATHDAPASAIGSDKRFGGYETTDTVTDVVATFELPDVTCETPRTAVFHHPHGPNVMPSVVALRSGRTAGGAGVAAECDFSDGVTTEVLHPVLFLADGNVTKLDEPAFDGDVVRVALDVDTASGTATSTLENLTQGWAHTTPAYAWHGAGIVQIGAARSCWRDEIGPPTRYDYLARFSRLSVTEVAIDGHPLQAGDAFRTMMVRELSGDPLLIPSIVADGDFVLRQ